MYRGPGITKEEDLQVIQLTKNNNAADPYQIPLEMRVAYLQI